MDFYHTALNLTDLIAGASLHCLELRKLLLEYKALHQLLQVFWRLYN